MYWFCIVVFHKQKSWWLSGLVSSSATSHSRPCGQDSLAVSILTWVFSGRYTFLLNSGSLDLCCQVIRNLWIVCVPYKRLAPHPLCPLGLPCTIRYYHVVLKSSQWDRVENPVGVDVRKFRYHLSLVSPSGSPKPSACGYGTWMGGFACCVCDQKVVGSYSWLVEWFCCWAPEEMPWTPVASGTHPALSENSTPLWIKVPAKNVNGWTEF